MKDLIARSASPKVTADNVSIAFTNSNDPYLTPDKPQNLPKVDESGNPWWLALILSGLGLIIIFKAISSKVKQIRDEHPNATHVVHAAVIGPKGDLYSMSDDREPKNTAGRPALEVLKGSGVTNILVCIVRYFGGTLLGTGGLVKAYGDSTKEVLGVIKTEPLIAKVSF